MESATPSTVVSTDPPALIAGRYMVGEPFASGGMGTVHLGRIVGAGGFSRVVAIKRLFPSAANDRAFREMLLEEARLVSRIRHPNVVPALDVVEDGRNLYIVMEYVHGPSLAQLLARAASSGEPIPVDIATGIIEAVLLGLHAAHEARGEDGTPLGIVHRDVSPQNILIGADGVTRLIDFGIAKAATRIQITDPGIVKGKKGYMAPEQFFSRPVSRQSDVYASSVVLWEALANRPLLKQDSGETSLRHAIETPVLQPSQYRSGIDAALDTIVLRGLALEPADRFSTAEAMAFALRSAHAVASAGDIARWLERFAPDELEMAEERVRLLEQLPFLAEAGAPPSVHAGWSAATTRRDFPRVRRRARWIGVGAIALATALVLVLGLKTPQRKAVGSTPAPPPPAVDPSPTSISAPVTSVPSPAPEDSSGTASATAVVSSPSRARRKLTKSPCDPPFTIDSNGHKHYHPNCF